MKWIEISVRTNQQASEVIAEKLMNMGANGTEMVDPAAFRQALENNKYLDYADNGLIDKYGTDVIVRAYFSENLNPINITDELKLALDSISAYMDIGSGDITYLLRDDSEWKDTWKQYFKPFKFTERIVIKPSWEEYIQKDDEIVIELDPGMAFGTGTHETTKMCALLGEKYVKANDRVLDLGCGTAILGLMAVKLGASSALAVDIDEAAVKTAHQNIENNGEIEKIRVMRGAICDVPKETFDLIFINIIADVIIEISKEINAYVKSGTNIILSGIIKERKAEVKSKFLDLGFDFIDELNMGEWEAMVFRA
ncbi:MAG: 50S ribosomal protein L11 methyltransferase [Acetivibrionales bacterium]|jgi:ribosomal protein L11 methyltransferase|nr:50S ribosomal protein L11 methyltransferase [Clostridiaceae bacterium]